jgi:uncharacterized protein YggE
MSTIQALDAQQTKAQSEGITVIGEAVRRALGDQAEILIEITATAATAAQALRDNQAKSVQVAQTVAALGVTPADIQTVSLNIHNVYSPLTQALPAYTVMPPVSPAQLSPSPLGPMAAFGLAQQPDVQFSSYHARSLQRVSVREATRVGEILDVVVRSGASVSQFGFKAPDEAGTRRSTLEAAGKEARAKAESLAAAAGRKIGEAVFISEDVVASNGTYTALRSAFPFSFGAGAPNGLGELEYYARVSASFRFQ